MSISPLIVQCNEAAAGSAPESDNLLRLRTYGRHRNVQLEIDEITARLTREAPPVLVDLVEIATLVYVADQIYHRGAYDTETMGKFWRRRFSFHLPVREAKYLLVILRQQ